MVKSNTGKIVTKRKQQLGLNNFHRVSPRIAATKQARAALGIKGFCAMKKGSPLYLKTKELYHPWLPSTPGRLVRLREKGPRGWELE